MDLGSAGDHAGTVRVLGWVLGRGEAFLALLLDLLYAFGSAAMSGWLRRRSRLQALAMRETPGEDTDHPWHRSVWFAHSFMSGVDFWNEGTGDNARFAAQVGTPLRLSFRRDRYLPQVQFVAPAITLESTGTLGGAFGAEGGAVVVRLIAGDKRSTTPCRLT